MVHFARIQLLEYREVKSYTIIQFVGHGNMS